MCSVIAVTCQCSLSDSTYHGVKADVIYRCETCQQIFANRSNLKIHEKHVHSTERLFTCDSCDKTFKRKKDVVRHQRQVRINEIPPTSTYSIIATIETHVTTHE